MSTFPRSSNYKQNASALNNPALINRPSPLSQEIKATSEFFAYDHSSTAPYTSGQARTNETSWLTKKLNPLYIIFQKLLGNHKRNNQIICVVQMISCLALIIECFIAVSISQAANPLVNVWSPHGFTGTWLWFAQFVLSTIVLLFESIPRFGNENRRYDVILTYIFLTTIINLTGSVYSVVYGNYHQLDVDYCNANKCTTNETLILAATTQWSVRFEVFVSIQLFCIHPSVSYFLELLKLKRKVQNPDQESNHVSQMKRILQSNRD